VWQLPRRPLLEVRHLRHLFAFTQTAQNQVQTVVVATARVSTRYRRWYWKKGKGKNTTEKRQNFENDEQMTHRDERAGRAEHYLMRPHTRRINVMWNVFLLTLGS
jgi:hypothetical protein